MACICDGLTGFCNASGQRVKFRKLVMFVSTNMKQYDALELCVRMGVPRIDDLGWYLGHHLVPKGRGSDGFDDLLKKVRDKLDGWKTGILSRATRLTLGRLESYQGLPDLLLQVCA